MFAFQVATAVVAEEESNNQRRRTEYRGSILDHNIVNRNRKKVEAHNLYSNQRTDALGVPSLSCLQKTTAAHMRLAYGIPADLTDEYLRIGKATAIESLRAFVKAIVEVFGDWYLRAQNEADSLIFAALVKGRTTPVNYTINGHEYTMGYYLADEIYPNWSTFVKTIPRSLGAKRKYFASKQESAIKDVERAFGVLQSRFAIPSDQLVYLDKSMVRYLLLN
eukprot:XP_024453889.1 uncharacterized protein LOC112326999 [Populus trichocarpa]